jgi:hypothetical protein
MVFKKSVKKNLQIFKFTSEEHALQKKLQIKKKHNIDL